MGCIPAYNDLLQAALIDRVAEIITRYNMFDHGSKMGVAVSGGADSVVLLNVLHRLRPVFGVSLVVLHANHKLRGAESDQDRDFVLSSAAALGLDVAVEDCRPEPGNVEEQAREARRAFFRRAAADLQLTRIALGHTRSDQAETVLFRFLRGSGTAGLAGMKPVSEEFCRPLLNVSREEVRGWAERETLRWREDTTNAEVYFTRNRLRRETIPLLSGLYNNNLESVLSATAEVARDEEAYWHQIVPAALAGVSEWHRLGLSIALAGFRILPSAVQRRVLREALLRLRGSLRGIDAPHIDALRTLAGAATGHGRCLIPGCDAVRSYDTLLLTLPGTLNEPRGYRFAVQTSAPIDLPFAAGRLCLEPVSPEDEICVTFEKAPDIHTETANIGCGILNKGTGGILYVRNWEPGDRFARPGRSPEKIKSLFQEYKVLLWERRHWPVLALRTESGAEEIVWTRQFGVSSKFVTAGSTDTSSRLRLRYSGVGSPGDLGSPFESKGLHPTS